MEPILYATAAVLAITAIINVAARRLDLPSPVLLVVAGIVLALIPGLPRIELPPDLVLLVFLPPIIYYAAFGMSWQAFCKNLRPIVLLAVGCVVFTTVTVAAAAHWLIGLSWPVAFVLGAIVSPPDVVAPLAIARRLGIPSRITAVLEGEGLVNDATALVLFKFALAATLTGTFSITAATTSFLTIVVAETAFGLVVGWLMLRLRHLARQPLIEVTLSLLTPFVAFWVPHEAGGSGVLATVVAGLYVGAKGVELIRSNTRLQALFFWDFVTYLIEGAIFLLTGLQARTVLDGLLGVSWVQLTHYGLEISLVAIVMRFVWVFPATYLPRLLSAPLRRREPPPPWQYPFIISFTGVRGVVSLAAALSIPLMMTPDVPFAQRHLVLFLTFSVILVTLVLQGPTMPWLVRRLGLVERGSHEQRERAELEAQTRIAAARSALAELDQVLQRSELAPEQAGRLRQLHEDRVGHLERRSDRDGEGSRIAQELETIELTLIRAERNYINQSLRADRISDEIRRRIERDLDLREEELRRNVRRITPDGT
ncbi:MAG: Na+/H+ antiporter [Burkholderiaceae bacterium]